MTDLLPCNATPQERALSEAIARLSDVPVLVREQWNPDTCPAALLPWLAWAMSVDVWDPAWTDAQKRGAIQASFAVHQRKGTIGAVRSALNALGLDIRMTEWFQDSPPAAPYTFRLSVVIDQSGVTQAQLIPVISVVESTKNLRSHLSEIAVEVTTRAASPVVGGTTVSGNNITVEFSA